MDMNKKYKLNQNGFVDINLVIILILVVAVIGLAGYRAHEARNASRVQPADASESQLQPEIENSNIKIEELSEQQVEEQKINHPPNSQGSPTQVSQRPATPSTDQGGAQTTEPKQPRQIFFVKGGNSADGDWVEVVDVMTEAHSGTCKYTFSLNGTVRVRKSVQISSTKTCSVNIPKSEFPKSADYDVKVEFTSSDGGIFASSGPYSMLIM